MEFENLLSVIDDYISTKMAAKPDKWLTKQDWLDDAAGRSKQITMVTHAPKYTHGDSKASGVMFFAGNQSQGYLSTACLEKCGVDAIGNAAVLDVANLLLLEVAGTRLMDCILQNDPSPLKAFATSDEKLANWMEGFALALSVKEVKSHTLAKQIYFPVANNHYHLLGPLFSSGLCQSLYNRINDARYSESAKAARDARKNNAISQSIVEVFPALAVQTFGGTKPQNTSLLNSKRGGKAYLLNCQPPKWQQQPERPQNYEDFWALYQYQIRQPLYQLKQFLLSVRKLDSTQVIRQTRAEMVELLIAELLQLATQIRQLPANWSQDCQFSSAYRIWLDTGAKQAELTPDWCTDIARDFALWLKQQLTHKYLPMGDVEYNHWRKQVNRSLRWFKADLETMA